MKISSEILTISPFAQSFLAPKEKSDIAMQFMICLDFLLKGVLIHWQIKLNEEGKGKESAKFMEGFETKFPLLLGDQYNSMAYYMVTRLGNNELTKLLTHIEENFWKIFYNLDHISSDFEQNLKIIYKHFYNYLPQFMGNTF
jgi:hypothetical protein